MEEMVLKQIIVVTDGRSNIGGNPSMAAKEANKNSITVSAIGIINKSDGEDSSVEEIRNIAEMGRGEWQLTYIDNLSTTLQMVTKRTVNKTIGNVVNEQLREIIGTELNEIKPKHRNKFVEYIENLSDEIPLKCCILMDCSGSMKAKMGKAKESILDLMSSLKSRKGKSEISVIAFPGANGEMTNIVTGFTDDMELIENKIKNMKANGTTPTAPAIYRAIDLFTNRNCKEEEIEEESSLLGESIV